MCARAFVAIAVCFAPFALLAATFEAKSARVVEVTVYPDRAEVVREATIDVPAGASTVEFKDIPVAAEPDSTLAPREKKDVVLAYTVRCPKDLLVPGLE